MKSKTSLEINNNYINWKEWTTSDFAKLSPQDKRYFDAELHFFSRQPADHIHALEIGFGNGKFLKYCIQAGWLVMGTEINPILVKIAREQGFNVLCSSSLSELSSNQFDLVAAFDVLEHIPQDQIIFFLQQINRVLKTNGICLLRFPNGDSPFGLANQNGDITHLSTIGSEKIRYFISQTSLKILCCRGECELLIEETFIKTMRRWLSLFFKKIINLFVWFVFYKKRNYCSDNLVVILKKIES